MVKQINEGGDTVSRDIDDSCPFTQIRNDLLIDEDMSDQARGFLCRLLSKPRDWKIRLSTFWTKMDKERAVRSSVNELLALGYMRRERIIDDGGKFSGFHYKVAGTPKFRDAQSLSSTTAFHTTGNSTRGKSSPTNKECTNKDGTNGVRGSSRSELPPASDAGADEDGGAITDADIRAMEADADCGSGSGHKPAADVDASQPEGAGGSTLELKSEDETPKNIPWAHIDRTFRRVCPNMRIPSRGATRRDGVIRRFWIRSGKTLSCFEELAKRVAGSDYLMGRNGHVRPDGSAKPVTWGWVFSKTDSGDWRYEKIMSDDYANDRMSWALEKAAKAAVTKCYLYPNRDRFVEVDVKEKLPGSDELRYKRLDDEEPVNGLPVYMDFRQ